MCCLSRLGTWPILKQRQACCSWGCGCRPNSQYHALEVLCFRVAPASYNSWMPQPLRDLRSSDSQVPRSGCHTPWPSRFQSDVWPRPLPASGQAELRGESASTGGCIPSPVAQRSRQWLDLGGAWSCGSRTKACMKRKPRHLSEALCRAWHCSCRFEQYAGGPAWRCRRPKTHGFRCCAQLTSTPRPSWDKCPAGRESDGIPEPREAPHAHLRKDAEGVAARTKAVGACLLQISYSIEYCLDSFACRIAE